MDLKDLKKSYPLHYYRIMFAKNAEDFDSIITEMFESVEGDNKFIENVGKMVLSDEDGLCVPVSNLRHSDGVVNFMMMNLDTGNKYRVEIKIFEI